MKTSFGLALVALAFGACAPSAQDDGNRDAEADFARGVDLAPPSGQDASSSSDLASSFDLVGAPLCAACAAYGAASTVGMIDDPATNGAQPITELSGIAASWRNPGLYYVHNDDGSTVYVVRLDGHIVAVLALTGATSDNFEDIAIGPCGDTSCVFAGNIGDNDEDHDSRQIHRFAEPLFAVDASEQSLAITVETITFGYEDGPHNAEALLVHPQSGDVYIATKDDTSGVYRLAASDATPGAMRTFVRVGTVALKSVTGGDIHPCGRRVLLRTKKEVRELVLDDDSAAFDTIWSVAPQSVPIPDDEDQAEAVGYDRDGLGYVLTYEGDAPRPLVQVRCE